MIWGRAAEFDAVDTAFAAVAAANNAWASRNHTEPLPIYLGEFGVDNAAATADRKKWLCWIRMEAERYGFAWAHWNMYNDASESKGMEPWTQTQRNDPSTRGFQADAVEALSSRCEAANGCLQGGVSASASEPGYTGTGYADFPNSTPSRTNINRSPDRQA